MLADASSRDDTASTIFGGSGGMDEYSSSGQFWRRYRLRGKLFCGSSASCRRCPVTSVLKVKSCKLIGKNTARLEQDTIKHVDGEVVREHMESEAVRELQAGRG